MGQSIKLRSYLLLFSNFYDTILSIRGAAPRIVQPSRGWCVMTTSICFVELFEEAKTGDLVVLRDGSVVPRMVIGPLMRSLRELVMDDWSTFYELVLLSRNPQHCLFGSCGGRLVELHLLEQDGQPHDIIRKIVLAATEGEELDLHLVDPIAS